MVLVGLVDGGIGCALRGLFTWARRELTFRQRETGEILLIFDRWRVSRFWEDYDDGRYVEGV